jgi:hypothetical protein
MLRVTTWSLLLLALLGFGTGCGSSRRPAAVEAAALPKATDLTKVSPPLPLPHGRLPANPMAVR